MKELLSRLTRLLLSFIWVEMWLKKGLHTQWEQRNSAYSLRRAPDTHQMKWWMLLFIGKFVVEHNYALVQAPACLVLFSDKIVESFLKMSVGISGARTCSDTRTSVLVLILSFFFPSRIFLNDLKVFYFMHDHAFYFLIFSHLLLIFASLLSRGCIFFNYNKKTRFFI